jgi:hypothetical protein
MGVVRTDYLMLGIDVGGDALDHDKHQAEVEGAPGARFDIIYDGMCGNYCIAGKIIAKSQPYDDGIEMVKIDFLSLAKLISDSTALAVNVGAAFDRKVSPGDFALILFSHFS